MDGSGGRTASAIAPHLDWRNPVKWQKSASAFFAEHGRRQRVFCASLADVFDNQAPPEWRADLFTLIRQCPDLVWQVLSKRPQNMARFLPPDWGDGYPNVWLGASAESQDYYDQRRPISRQDASGHPFCFVSAGARTARYRRSYAKPDWLICGAESAPGHRCGRPCDPAWVRSIRDQCTRLGVTFLLKQLAGPSGKIVELPQLDGRTWADFPC